MFPGEDDNPTYSSRFKYVPDALVIVDAAVRLAKVLGPERTLIRRGLDSLRTCMAKCRELDELTSDLDLYYNRWNSFYIPHEQYSEFRQALNDTARDLRHSQFLTISVMVPETIHAMWILSVIIRFYYAYRRSSIISLVFNRDFASMFPHIETTNTTLDELYDDVDHARRFGCLELRGYWGEIHIRYTYIALDLIRQSVSDPAGLDGSASTVAKIIGLLNEDVDSTYKPSREEASKHCS